jgi:hypothetical protein
MLKLLQSIFAGRGGGEGSVHDERLLERATEYLVDATDPRLRVLSSYKRKLRAGVERAVEHAIRLGDAIDPVVELSRTAFGHDAKVRSLFASPEHLEETLSASMEIQQWLARSNVPPATLYALLVVNWEERHSFGMELDGDTVRRDVAQVTLNFADHRFPAAGGTEADARLEVKKRAYDLLVKAALARLVEQRSERQDLERERLLLARKLKELDGVHMGLALEATPAGPQQDSAAVEARIHEIEQALAHIRADTATLDDQLALIDDTLRSAPQILTLDSVSFVLDQRNVKRAAPNASTIREVQYPLVRSGNRRAIVLMTKFPRAAVRPPADMLAEMERYLR